MIIKLLKNAFEFIRNAVNKIYSFFEYFFSQNMGEKYNKKEYVSNLKNSENKNSDIIVKSSIDQNIDQGAGAFACRRTPLDLSNYLLNFLDYKNLQIVAQTPNLTLDNSIVYNKKNDKVAEVILQVIGNERGSLIYKISLINDVSPIFVQELLNLVYLIAHELMLNDYFIDKLIVEIGDNNYEESISKILPITLYTDKFGKTFKLLKKDESFAELISECRNKFYPREDENPKVPDLFPVQKNTALQYPIKFTELLSGYNNYVIKLNVDRQTDSMPFVQSKTINALL